MAGLISLWLESIMEDPVVREKRFEARMTRQIDTCKAIRTEWTAPNRTDGNWRKAAERMQKASTHFKGGYVPNAHTPNQTTAVDKALYYYQSKTPKEQAAQ